MAGPPMYHEGSRELQDRFDSRRLADRLETVTAHATITPDDRRVIERSAFFFLATADADGWPDVSYKGGEPGFVHVVDETTVVVPSYDGNGQFRSLGNVLVNPKVGLLFIDFERPGRLRLQGTAAVDDDPARVAAYEGAQVLLRIGVERIFPNCPRYIHQMQVVERSPYSPRPGYRPPEPDWKSHFADVLPGSDHPDPGAGTTPRA